MNRSGVGTALAAVVADSLAILLSFWLSPWLVRDFSGSAPASAVIAIAVYLGYCLSVYLLRRVGDDDGAAPAGSRLVAAGLVLGLAVAYVVVDLSGLRLEALLELDLGSARNSLATVLGLAGLLGLVFLYAFVLVVPVAPQPAGGEAHTLLRLPALLAADLALIVSFAYCEASIAAVAPAAGPTIWVRAVVFVAVYAVAALLYGGPRLMLARGGAGPIPVLTFLLQTAYYMWALLSRAL